MILNFAPLAPQARDCSLGGNKNQFAGKSPPNLGDLGGFYVANDTSQTTSNPYPNPDKCQEVMAIVSKYYQ
ncbi:hypothetical protein LYNGBM3L_01660 [Moorena producens 3L]|uniref:Uncharacterized protein n=1 Tax=Moorena producens 3L TaxID=489825 RepID=F4XIB7_9CYAN|nr:hypothetical protein LYNGBM3L_01660 [Moorena producens 3L]OLT67537.1 hypothetical protein BI334_23120 [Moorena producens 3L]